MSIEQVSELASTVEITRNLEYLPRILARQVLATDTHFWDPDYLSKQMADDIAWEIGKQAHVVLSRQSTHMQPEKNDSYALQIDRYDNVVHIYR